MAHRSHIEEIEEQAALFALGASSPEEAQKFAQRLATDCPVCRAELRACEQAAAALALSVSPVAPPAEARRRLLNALDGKVAGSTRLSEGLLVRKDGTDWKDSPVPGVQVRNLYREKTVLVRMAPNTRYPAHDHHAAEQCLVLEGSISSEGVTAYAGDFTYMPSGSSHAPLYSENGCLLLIAYT